MYNQKHIFKTGPTIQYGKPVHHVVARGYFILACSILGFTFIIYSLIVKIIPEPKDPDFLFEFFHNDWYYTFLITFIVHTVFVFVYFEWLSYETFTRNS
ncbi:hypothetical protein M0811_09862 [Anaeramoeba ignava]|uniref:Uncharacterized protein n=1 Tax=Anaeramoeba ignava TaxID=1746090 RepID=A0A9Q0LFM9_ANAIG|nr:hypothetical protein M0811_09862 [Anaeramoeba ignava]